MPSLHRYKLFISHSWGYDTDYNRVIQMLNDANNFIYSNYSIPWEKRFEGLTNSQLKEELKGQIRPVEVVLILGGMYVAHSEWIQYEIDFAKSLNKPIIGIRPWGAERMPVAVQNAADEIVGWQTSSIVDAIRRLAL